MSGTLSVLVAAGAGPHLPTSTQMIDNTGSPATGSITVKPDGTITYSGGLGTSSDTIWYSPPSGAPGNSYFIKFVLASGTAWTAGLTSGTVYALSSARALAWSTNTSITASVTVTFYLDAGGTLTVGSFNLTVAMN